MPAFTHAFLDWFDARTGYRAGVRALLDEPLPAGVGWWFTLGSVLLFLLVVQWLTGLVLALYYVPTPDHAYDSVRLIITRVTFGRLVRALHVFGSSFIVVAAMAHLLRVVSFGAYKRPREVTWMSGVLLLIVILAFALSGYLLPWDQRAYWATVVTVNIARAAPLVGEPLATLLRGGTDLGALTLSRWYAAHVMLLPAALVLLVVTHLYLMRRHGVAGPIRPRAGERRPFYPDHAIRDTVAVACVFAALLTLSTLVDPALDAIADPTDASYTPRPEWYFLGLFQLLKYFPGRLEIVGAIAIPGLAVCALFLLPFLDRTSERRPRALRRVWMAATVVMMAVTGLTWLGLRDSPANPDVNRWGLRAIGGRELAGAPACGRCHRAGGAGPLLATLRPTRDDEWVVGHLADPDMIAPGLRAAPPGGLRRLEGQAVVAYIHKLRVGAPPPWVAAEDLRAAVVFASRCIACHRIDGDGGDEGPDLSRVGAKRDAAWIARRIVDPTEVDPDAEMPAFGDTLEKDEISAVARYLARRR